MPALDNSRLSQLSQQLFQSAISAGQFEGGKKILRKDLINILNYVNFQDNHILINFRHLKYKNIISLQAKPQPCLGEELNCLWAEPKESSRNLSSYEFVNFFIINGKAMIVVTAELKKITNEGVSLALPEICYETTSRRVKRYLCEGIRVELVQNGITFYGLLQDFSALSFSAEVSIIPPQTFNWVNPDLPVFVLLKNMENTMLYSGECRILRHTYGQKTRTFVFEPTSDKLRRFKPKEYRSRRHKLAPSPNIAFSHPFTKKKVNLQVDELSGSGISVIEHYDNSKLFAGMIIPELFIEFANDFKIRCKAQVVSRNVNASGEKLYVTCGIAILDMDMQDQVRLSSLLHKMTNEKSCVCNSVDMDSLWKFFFETGFVYPKKYAVMHNNKEKFKETYEKLYIQSPHIARHFVYQDKGIILGHISMLRTYENTWLFHHHAASSNGGRAGLVVLDQIGRYVNDFYCLYSTHMDFIICYFRPENRFPNRVFGGCAREVANPKGCSIDAFAYFHFPRNFESWDLPGALISKTRAEDLRELESFYEHESGGLALNALDLEPDLLDCDNLSKDYAKIGLKRDRQVFSLAVDGCLKAIIMLNISDIGLNLSNLTNCIHVFVIDADLPRNILISTISNLSKYYEQNEIPVLLHPVSYAEKQFIPYEKIYNMWVLNISKSGEEYLKHIEKLVAQIRRV